MSRTRSLLAALAAVVVLAVGFPVVAGSFASADGTPDVSLTKSAPAAVLYGGTSAVSLDASNTTAQWGYNLSFRDVLPEGVSYVPGSAEFEPTILDDQPDDGQTTLLWTNVADLAPSNTYSFGYEVAHASDPADASGTVDCDAAAPPAP